jgi:hypothetical protein
MVGFFKFLDLTGRRHTLTLKAQNIVDNLNKIKNLT